MEDTVEAALEKYRQRPLGGVVLQGLRRGKYYERCDGVVWFSRLFISKMLPYFRFLPSFISDQSPEASTSNTSLITMPPTTSSLKTHTGHGHHRDRSSEGPHLGSSAPPSAGHHRPRHHSGGYSRRSSTKVNYGGLKALEKLKSPGITTPQPVLTSEVRKSSKYTY